MGTRLRFNDMIATVLRQSEAGPPALAAKWRQIVDLLAQQAGDESDDADPALEWLRAERPSVAAAIRREAAEALAGRRVTARILIFFAEDIPAVAQPLLAGALLSAEEWIEVLPWLGPTARSLLRHRRDLPGEVDHALAGFGASDFALAGSAEGAISPAIERGETQIRDLVQRIENFRRHREAAGAPEPEETPRIENFRWEAGPDGIMVWVDGAPRGPIVGQSIASIADRGQHGVDGQAAGAFEKRAPFRDARFNVAGSGIAAGDWRISGVPFFDPALGHFLGYRGTARRPRVDEVARVDGGARIEAEPPAGLFGTGIPADSLRQLIHELRTPLNAIVGFAEMIDGQYMGPAAASYRSRAADIMEQARRLLSAVDDLDTAARIETSRLQLDENPVDAVALLCRLHDAYERVARQRGSRITIEIERDLPPVRVELGAAERMFARMLAATIGLAGEDETIAATMAMGEVAEGEQAGRRMLCLAIDRPRAIAGMGERELLDPGYSPEGDWPGAPALGLGFALRLVRNLAEAVGGALAVGESKFALYLPTDEPAERSSGQGR
jgi:signal transduction histidine kinase